MEITSAEFVISNTDVKKCPAGIFPEYAFIGCYMSVNDDAIAIKGGKGTWADQAPENGPVYNVLIQNCTYEIGRAHV